MNLFRIHIIVLFIFISVFAEEIIIDSDGYGKYSGQISKSYDVIGNKSLLEMTKIRGDIIIHSSSSGKKIIITEIFDLKAYSKSKAKNLLDKSKASYVFRNNELSIRGNDNIDNYHSYFDISVPKKVHLEISSSMGDVSIQNISGKMSVITTQGDIDMEKVNGNISIQTTNGSFSGEDMKADINCYSVNGDIYLYNISGNLSLQTSDGDISIDQIVGSGKINTSSGCIEIDNLTGEQFSAETSRGDIEIGIIDAQLTLKASGGCIYMTYSKQDVTFFCSGGNFVIKKNEGNINGNVSGGDITIGSVSGFCKISARSSNIQIFETKKNLEIATSDGNIEIEKANGKVLANTSNGNIIINKKIINNSDNDIDLKVKYGDIIINLPKKLSADITAKIYAHSSSINDYEISSDFNIDNYKMVNKGSKSYIFKKGQINNGGIPILLQTVHGDITINRVD